MCNRHTTIPFKFACITEDPSNLTPGITHIPIPDYNLSGWWFKPWVFSKEFPLHGTIMFMDLDLVIMNNIDNLWQYSPESFCIIRDFNRVTDPTWKKFNSSVFKFKSHEYTFVWDDLMNDPTQINKYHGDQAWIYECITDNYQYFPDSWIKSYKWEIRNRNEITNTNGVISFNSVKNPVIPDDTSILVFHGEPKPENVNDFIIMENWI
jgi:hypothetical protein